MYISTHTLASAYTHALAYIPTCLPACLPACLALSFTGRVGSVMLHVYWCVCVQLSRTYVHTYTH